MPVKGIIIILLFAVVIGVAYSREIYETFINFIKNENEDKENKE